MEKKFNEFWVFGGMGAGFGGPGFLGTVEGVNIDDDDVQQDARQLVVDDYESYAGLHGIPSREDVEEELRENGDDPDEQDIEDVYNEHIDSWTSMWLIPAVDGENPEDPKWLDTAPWKEDF